MYDSSASTLRSKTKGLGEMSSTRRDAGEELAVRPRASCFFAIGLQPTSDGDLRDGRDAQVVRLGHAFEARGGAVGARGVVGVLALAVLPGGRNTHAQQLIADSVDQRLRRVREVDLLAARHAAVRFQQAADQRQRVRLRQMREAARDVLATALRRRGRRSANGSVGAPAPTMRPVVASRTTPRPNAQWICCVRFAAAGLPEMDAARLRDRRARTRGARPSAGCRRRPTACRPSTGGRRRAGCRRGARRLR